MSYIRTKGLVCSLFFSRTRRIRDANDLRVVTSLRDSMGPIPRIDGVEELDRVVDLARYRSSGSPNKAVAVTTGIINAML